MLLAAVTNGIPSETYGVIKGETSVNLAHVFPFHPWETLPAPQFEELTDIPGKQVPVPALDHPNDGQQELSHRSLTEWSVTKLERVETVCLPLNPAL